MRISFAERAKQKWDWDKDRTELDTAIMKEAVEAAIREKLRALVDMDVPDEM